MTEDDAMGPFERRFAERARLYTDAAAGRTIDALDVSRAAMSASRSVRWTKRPMVGLPLDGRFTGVKWAAPTVAVILIAAVGFAISRPSPDHAAIPLTASPSSPARSPSLPDALRHAWARPYAVTPGLDHWGSGSLIVSSERIEFGPEPAAPGTSRAAVRATGVDTLVVTATRETHGCEIGAIGSYRATIDGQGTVLMLSALADDACELREKALAGSWVRADLAPSGNGEITLPPGTYTTADFDPFGDRLLLSQLSYTVSDGWKVKDDRPRSFLLHHLATGANAEGPGETFIQLLAKPRVTAGFEDESDCEHVEDAAGIGTGVDDVVAAITTRPGVVSSVPAPVVIGGYDGKLLDVHLSPSWRQGCRLSGSLVVTIPLLREAGTEFAQVIAVGSTTPLRLIVLDLDNGRTMTIAIFGPGPTRAPMTGGPFETVMPVVESFEFHPRIR